MCAIPLTNQEQMCLLLREAMNVGKIALSDCFFSTELGDREARQRLKDELSSYCVVSEAPKTTFGKFRKVCLCTTASSLERLSADTASCVACTDVHGQALWCRFLLLHRTWPLFEHVCLSRVQANKTTFALRFSWP